MVRAAEQQQGRLLAFRACELPSHGAYFTHANCRQLHLAAVVARAHEAPRPVVPLRRHRGFGRYPATSLPTTAPTKCLRPLDPLVSFPVAPEATRGQRFAALHLTEEPSWVIRTRELDGSPSIFFFHRTGVLPPLACWGSGGMAQPVGPLFGTRWPNRGPGPVPARAFPAPLQGGGQTWPS